MATPTNVLWDRDPHTAAKHQMLTNYLDAWFPIITKGFPHAGLTFVDAFAGPGEYSQGEIGSPLIALNQAHRHHVTKHGSPVRLLFIEKDSRRFEHLETLIAARFPASLRPASLDLRTVNGACEEKLIPALVELGAQAGPLFVNLDGWGADTPLRLVKHVGRQRGTEVLVTFATQHFVRFANQEETKAGDRVFGDTRWRALVATSERPLEKKRRLVDHYRYLLEQAGFPLFLTFELVDSDGRAFLLIFGTGSELGLERMKEAMWKVDHVRGQRFRDPRDLNQLALPIGDEPDLSLLERQLIEQLESLNAPASLADLKRFTLLETIYKPTHAALAVRHLEERRAVTCEWGRGHENVVVELAPLSLF